VIGSAAIAATGVQHEVVELQKSAIDHAKSQNQSLPADIIASANAEKIFSYYGTYPSWPVKPSSMNQKTFSDGAVLLNFFIAYNQKTYDNQLKMNLNTVLNTSHCKRQDYVSGSKIIYGFSVTYSDNSYHCAPLDEASQ